MQSFEIWKHYAYFTKTKGVRRDVISSCSNLNISGTLGNTTYEYVRLYFVYIIILKTTLEKVCYGPPLKSEISPVFRTYLSPAVLLPGAVRSIAAILHFPHSVDIQNYSCSRFCFQLPLKHISPSSSSPRSNQQNCSSVISMCPLMHGTYLLKIAKCFLRNELYFYHY